MDNNTETNNTTSNNTTTDGYLCEGGAYCYHGCESTHWVDMTVDMTDANWVDV